MMPLRLRSLALCLPVLASLSVGGCGGAGAYVDRAQEKVQESVAWAEEKAADAVDALPVTTGQLETAQVAIGVAERAVPAPGGLVASVAGLLIGGVLWLKKRRAEHQTLLSLSSFKQVVAGVEEYLRELPPDQRAAVKRVLAGKQDQTTQGMVQVARKIGQGA